VLIRYAFKEMSVPTIVAFVHPDNYPAQRLAARIGLLRIGVILHPEHGQDCIRYALENHSE
ncbi:MAG: GNAT family protein, partial [Bacteroidetes bacterium]|nr:GNAT family protein [Bacteroidota bacterium]